MMRRPSGSTGRAERATRALLLATAALLFLQAAATIHVRFTVPLSDVTAAGAVVVGMRFIPRGWRTLPRFVRVAGLVLFAIYGLAALAGHETTLAGEPRTGALRAVIYVGFLAVGLAALTLVAAVFQTAAQRSQLMWALLAGAALAALYACYQSAAIRFGWSLTNLNNTAETNGIAGTPDEGTGILGWPRARGTFVEPHFLGEYAATVFPLCIALMVARGRRSWLAGTAAVLVALALLLTSSAPDEAALGIGILLAVACAAISRGRILLGAAAAVLVLAAPVAVASPSLLASLTGRSRLDVTLTTKFRTDTWSRAIHIWERRPILGFGPGQSAVQLTAQTAAATGKPPGPLQSAQGIWASSLIDAGALGFLAWALLLGGSLFAVARACVRRPSLGNCAVVTAVTTTVVGTELAGDRVELLVWLVVGLALARSGAERRATGPI